MNAANNDVAQWSHIELSAGTVTSSTIEGEHGVRQVFSDVGKFMFYVDAVEVGGTRLGLNSCENYESAIRLAEAARVDFEINLPVKDNVVGSH